MAQNNQKNPTPVPQAAPPAQDGQAATKKAKKFSFSFNFFSKNNSDKEFAGKVAPSKRELEARAAKRRAQRAKTHGHQSVPSTQPDKEEAEEQLQPV